MTGTVPLHAVITATVYCLNTIPLTFVVCGIFSPSKYATIRVIYTVNHAKNSNRIKKVLNMQKIGLKSMCVKENQSRQAFKW